ncbi:MAG: hypothetical protein FJ221_13680 [Lentisphaerae bacterium]|nr:hypothetical protein [Lentisphaerota bacterium]
MTAEPWVVYAVLIVTGILMLGAEIYVPGGILGVLGALCLVGAMVAGFFIDTRFGFLSAGLIIVLSAAGLYLFVLVFPKTGAGRSLTLTTDGRDFKAAPDGDGALEGRTGTAESALRPSGIALVDGRRMDVIATGLWIEPGTRIRITAVHGSRIEVAPVAEPGA